MAHETPPVEIGLDEIFSEARERVCQSA